MKKCVYVRERERTIRSRAGGVQNVCTLFFFFPFAQTKPIREKKKRKRHVYWIQHPLASLQRRNRERREHNLESGSGIDDCVAFIHRSGCFFVKCWREWRCVDVYKYICKLFAWVQECSSTIRRDSKHERVQKKKKRSPPHTHTKGTYTASKSEYMCIYNLRALIGMRDDQKDGFKDRDVFNALICALLYFSSFSHISFPFFAFFFFCVFVVVFRSKSTDTFAEYSNK